MLSFQTGCVGQNAGEIMIEALRGICVKKSPAQVVIEVGGVAFSMTISLTTSEKLVAVGSETRILTHLHVREDALELYGFHSEAEREFFIQLLKVSGVGPKLALSILSRFSPAELSAVVADGDVKRLTVVKGIGGRTAERLMLELKNRLDIETPDGFVASGQEPPTVTREAMQALEALGFTLNQADEAVRKAKQDLGGNTTVEELLKQALKR
ncbi:Holliday junction branch migration protein RuvA [Calditrichota bacterium]